MPDIVPQQAGSTNAQRTGIRNVVITLFNFQRYARQMGFRVQRNIRHPAQQRHQC